MSELLNVDHVLDRILSQLKMVPTEQISIAQGLLRVLAEDILAQENIPAFANSSMDGYAVRADDVRTAGPDSPAKLTVIDDIPAGTMPSQSVGPMQAARIMTGAPLPGGADAVVPVERTDDKWEADGQSPLPPSVTILAHGVNPGDNVRPEGENVRFGQKVLEKYTVLRPQDIGMLAMLGVSEILTVQRPRVVILAIGDELVDVTEPVSPGQIRNSNSYVLASLIEFLGGIPIRLPIVRDSLDSVRQVFEQALSHDPDMIISSAGVSAGTRDYVRTVLDELGHVDVWRVNLRPGKPFAFGQVGNVPFFGLPGNPVSSMVTFDVFVRPSLAKMSGRPDHIMVDTATLAESVETDGRRTYFRVRLERDGDHLQAYLTGTQSSGALMSMVLADGLLIIPEGLRQASAGESFPVRLLRPVS